MRQIERVRRARSQLVMKHPFYGCLALGLKLDASNPRVRTMAVNSTHLYVNEDWVEELTDNELRGVIVHEVKHLAYGHAFRRGRRDHREWNIAGDYAINRDLIVEGFTLPSSRLLDTQFDGMSAEQIYARRVREAEEEAMRQQQQQQAGGGPGQGEQSDDSEDDEEPEGGEQAGGQDPDEQDDDDGNEGSQEPEEPDDTAQDTGAGDEPKDEPDDGGDEPGDDDGDDEGDGEPEPLDNDPGGCGEVLDAADEMDPADLEEEEARVKAMVINAAMIAKSQGTLPASIEALIAEHRKPAKENWRLRLRRFVNESTSKDHSWARPNRRFIGSGLYLPSLQSVAIDHVLVAVDTSGSVMDPRAQGAFSDELQELLDCGIVDRITVIYCDRVIHGDPEEHDKGDVISLRRPGGGGTDFAPVTEWAADQQAACLIYFTDLECWSFGEDPGLPVLWARWGEFNNPRIPFGEVVEIDPHQ